jgi:hypothetical protein
MTWSLQTRNGDLTLGDAHYGTVTGEAKLVQDLRAYFLEKMGTDNMHPGFGSLMDGGTRPDGTVIPGVIGLPNKELAELEIDSEIRRLFGNYQARQLARAKDDRLSYGKTTLHRGEVALAIQEIKYEAVEDSLTVTITVETARDSTIDIELSLEGAIPLR